MVDKNIFVIKRSDTMKTIVGLESLDDTMEAIFSPYRKPEKWVKDKLDELCYDLEREKYAEEQGILVENCANNLDKKQMIPIKKRLIARGYDYLIDHVFAPIRKYAGI